GLFVMTPESQKKFSLEERQYLVLRLQKAAHNCLSASPEAATRVATTVLIPSSSAGALTDAESNDYEESRKSLGPVTLLKKVRIKLGSQYENFHDCLAKALADIPAEFVNKSKEPPDLIYKSYDLSNYEEVAFIRSLIYLQMLDIGDDNREDWMRRYIAEGDAKKRMFLLKNAQYRALWLDPAIIPIWNYDVSAIIRRPWTLNFSPLSFYNLFYQVRYGTEGRTPSGI
ncbi:MAG TPA: hypothetical protein VE954_38755, partial [Oligoflexus sp.]|uniref:hypothetical protein n=1 Tax=Oligoflexus sp. TaxID=1971216 RepID=UPI002D6B80B3